MIRRPLRPLATILNARLVGEDPDEIEQENLRARYEAQADQENARSVQRLLILGMVFLIGFGMIIVRMGALAATEPQQKQPHANSGGIAQSRADIVDRHGNVLAKNLATHSLYAHPQEMVDPIAAASGLAAIFPELDGNDLQRRFTSERRFIWLRKRISPEEMQAVHDLGEPGLLFGPREMRLYPNGPVAAHVLGGSGFGRESVHAAEIIGVAGVEAMFEERLRDPARLREPLRLSLDLAVQSAMEEILAAGMVLMNAKGASAVLLDAFSGEIIGIASLPDFDPNNRPRPPVEGAQDDSPLFNRAVQGVYELGSVFKPLTVAQALDLELLGPNAMVDTAGPLRWGRHRINDFHRYGSQMSVTEVIEKSSNVGTARIAQMIGTSRQRAFLDDLGLLRPSPIELTEARGAVPLLPANWSELSTMTISFGHGLSVSPVMLAGAYAPMVNGGYYIEPTLLAKETNGEAQLHDAVLSEAGKQVISRQTSQEVTTMLARVVSHGTASFARRAGYPVGGKTGTADKPRPQGGYFEDRVIASFASAFPIDDPRYVLVVTLDEPEDTSGTEPRRTAGWTAVPVATEMIRRVGPLLGLVPR